MGSQDRVPGSRVTGKDSGGLKARSRLTDQLFNRLAFIYGGAGGGVTAPLFVTLKIRCAAEATVKERLDGGNSAVRVPGYP